MPVAQRVLESLQPVDLAALARTNQSLSSMKERTSFNISGAWAGPKAWAMSPRDSSAEDPSVLTFLSPMMT